MKIAVAQITCSLGNPEANLSKVHDFSRRAKAVGAELIAASRTNLLNLRRHPQIKIQYGFDRVVAY